jgi:phosphoglycolate phosphatase
MLLRSLSTESSISERVLIDQFRDLHRKYGTPECSFLLQEIPALSTKDPAADIRKLYDASLHAYYSERKKHLSLFRGVRETLVQLRKQGVLIIAFTEARDFYAAERIRLRGLDGLVDVLYSPPDHAMPTGFTRYYPDEYYMLKLTIHRRLHHDTLKPDPQVLLDILQDCDIRREEAIYIGDKRHKDVRMAQLAGVRDVYAAYGDATDKAGYDLLRRVSHWTDADIAREASLCKHADLEATYTLENGFSEILRLFSFVPFRATTARTCRPTSHSAQTRRSGKIR